ncbi:MAG: T9SS type A sorting domain-containing protein [Ignavibacteria bacterium]|nr:T9SS type A sorting domain-containing protein [Ignavibacteria bacterium]
MQSIKSHFAITTIALAVCLPFVLFLSISPAFSIEEEEQGTICKYDPSEWFLYQRAWPYTEIPYKRYIQAALDAKNNLLGKSPYESVQWAPAGPSNIGGRITAIEADPNDLSAIYIGAAAGGIFKSTDAGNSWFPLTDAYPSLSVGCLTMAPDNPQILYCGTGEANIATDSYPGFGILKTTNGGISWFKSGLDSTRHIAEIKIHPLNTNTIFAAASGGLYSKGPHRGIYRSTDAGRNWYKVLYINDSTSAIDIALDPTDTSRVYAAVWSRLRGPSFRNACGINTALYLSTNGGWTWQQMTNGLPAPSATTGRISIAVAPSNPNIVYALFKTAQSNNISTNIFGGFYRSTNKGISWTRMPDGPFSGFSNFGWYFGLLKVAPDNPLKVYLGEVDLYLTTDGGNNWSNITNSYSGDGTFTQQHPDQHALWMHQNFPNVLLNGNDGGFFLSTDGGIVWEKKYNLPISQFYAAAVDPQNASHKFGGLQDNGSVGTFTGQTNDWKMLLGGDGFVSQVDYTNSNILYAESQNGYICRSTDGGNNYTAIQSGLDRSRSNWNTPFIIDPVDPSILYFGSYKLFKTTNRGDQWSAISNDLTRGANGSLGTITAISAAKLTNGDRVLYVATNDAKLSVSTNTGVTWFDRTGSLPQRYMTDVVADKRKPEIAYITLSGYNLDEPLARVFRTTDYGVTWKQISSTLPDVPVNSILIDYNHDSTLIVGTDLGVYYTQNLGNSWFILGTGLPNAPVTDIVLHEASHELIAATHGRSLFKADITALVSVNQDSKNKAPSYFSVQEAYPNPFNPTCKITFRATENSRFSILLFDQKGKEVRKVAERYYLAGQHTITINGSGLSSGVYFIRITNGRLSETKKVVLIK